MYVRCTQLQCRALHCSPIRARRGHAELTNRRLPLSLTPSLSPAYRAASRKAFRSSVMTLISRDTPHHTRFVRPARADLSLAPSCIPPVRRLIPTRVTAIAKFILQWPRDRSGLVFQFTASHRQRHRRVDVRPSSSIGCSLESFEKFPKLKVLRARDDAPKQFSSSKLAQRCRSNGYTAAFAADRNAS